MSKNIKEEGERKKKKKKKGEKEQVSTSSSLKNLVKLISSATVKADRLFIESYQTLFCLTTHHVFKSKSAMLFISEEKNLIFFFFYII